MPRVQFESLLEDPVSTPLKKPVKPTKAEIAKSVAKRKTMMRTEYGALPTGTLEEFIKGVQDFAEKHGVTPGDIKIQRGWHPALTCKRMETDAEKTKRVADEMNSRYREKVWAWESAERQRKLDEAQADLPAIRRAVQVIRNAGGTVYGV
jgi:hypothetical protein